ncbi:MAG: ParB/RepB/Spo0J family partition protein [Clostridia bacterium]|nr:ParB/RepB/Spo0J family partition protein [Loktanella sp.]MBQ1950076.1 ParB/RepB/Spo0J family partition protein [Clostridia bacterium]
MAMKKGGLGKGLDVLFAQNTLEDENRAMLLPLEEIIPNREQPRKQFDEAALAELADSIAQHGVLQPLLVRPMPDGSYQLVAGERRWRASRMAGLSEVPVVVREMNEQEAAQLALIENLQREDLNPMEEAYGYQTLMDSYGMTQEETAQVVNKSRPAVANALRLLHLPEPVSQLVSAGSLSAGHARTVLAFEGVDAQIAVAQQAVEKGLSVRELERMAKSAKVRKNPSLKPTARRDSFYDEVALALRESLGRQVKVTTGTKGGTLQVEFFNEEDLRALANKLAAADTAAAQ